MLRGHVRLRRDKGPLPLAWVDRRADGGVIVGMSVALHDAVVLAVDDDEEMRDLLALILGRHVREVLVAGSVDEAMTVLESVHPALIVSDICMPDSDGYDLIRRVRSSRDNHATPAVALSAYAQDACRDAALAAGYDMFLRKPLDMVHFVPVLAALLHG
jgi:CheY-like chemotaxis protein